MKLIDKDAVVAEIEKLRKNAWESFQKRNSTEEQYYIRYGVIQDILSFLDTLEVKEVDLDALGVLAEHLLACDAHAVSPKYRDEELNLLEELKNNKAQKGE